MHTTNLRRVGVLRHARGAIRRCLNVLELGAGARVAIRKEYEEWRSLIIRCPERGPATPSELLATMQTFTAPQATTRIRPGWTPDPWANRTDCNAAGSEIVAGQPRGPRDRRPWSQEAYPAETLIVSVRAFQEHGLRKRPMVLPITTGGRFAHRRGLRGTFG